MIWEMLGGGLLRLAPEVMKVWDKKNDRAHEKDLALLSIEADKARAASQIAIQESQAGAAYDAAALETLQEAVKGQSAQTGIRWVDALSCMVRPTITFAYFGLYAIVRIVVIASMLWGRAPASSIVAAAWTAEDMEVMSGILSFWFLDRILTRAKR